MFTLFPSSHGSIPLHLSPSSLSFSGRRLPRRLAMDSADSDSVANTKPAGGYPCPISPPYPALSKAIELHRAMTAAARSAAYVLSPKDIIFEDDWLFVVNKPSGIYCETLLSSLSFCSKIEEKEMGSNSRALDSSNLGFQLLKRSGWKEGTGLGASEQGILEPVQTQIRKNKCGIGAEKKKKRELLSTDYLSDSQKEKTEKKPKAQSKRLRKMMHKEQQMKEKEFDQAFFREFWPDNV